MWHRPRSASIVRTIACLSIAWVIACCLALTGCFLDTTSLVNVQTFDVSQVESISVSYTTDSINVFQSSSDELVLKEYMSKDQSDRYAEVNQDDNSISIASGNRSGGSSIESYVELYVPKDWHGTIAFSTTSGYLKINPDLDVAHLSISTTSGSISLGKVVARSVTLATKSGSIKALSLDAKVSCVSETGSAEISKVIGYGSLQSTSGKISVGFSAVEGDISISSKTGRVTLSIPQVSSFDLKVLTHDGYVRLPFPTSQTLEVDTFAYKLVYGMIGTHRIHDIDLTTKSGAVYVQYYGYY